MTNNKPKISRRLFCFTAAGASGLALVGMGCGGGGEEALSCNDVSGLSAAEQATRTSTEYVDASPHGVSKQCLNCNFKQNLTATACGGCTVVPGPVHPNGYCNLWVAAT